MATRVQQFRIFLSSPGDVVAERDVARDLIKDVLPYSPFIRGRATFDVVSWDDPHAAPGLDAHLTPQEAINRRLAKPSMCDIVIVILWSRMGTPLPPTYTKADGSTYQSGTEWEYEDSAGGSGVTLLYRRAEEPTLGARDPSLQEKLAQLGKVDAFFEQFRGADGSLSGSVTPYETVDGFKTLLRQNLESVVSGLLGDAFSDELGVTKAAVENMLNILEEREVPPEQLETKLKEIAEQHVALTERLHQLSRSNDEPEVTKRREQAADAIEQGDYDRAEALLAEAVVIGRKALDEKQDALDREKISVAATIGQQGELERTRLNYRKAAEHFADAAGLVEVVDSDARFSYQMKQASVLSGHGREFGDNPTLVEAIDVYRVILEEQPRERVPLDWAGIQNNLGNALYTLGERESGTSRLEDAVSAYRLALEERTRERVPLDWAMTQNNLGTALRSLGERESDASRLEDAVSAYRLALEERTRERVPLDWARTQNNLGKTLKIVGERTGQRDQLDAALEAVRKAAEVFLDEAGHTHREAEFNERIAEIEAAITRLS